MKTSVRRTDLDVAKGIGIIMVVWAHAQGPCSSYITYFHMPLFFFISGLLFVPEKKTVKEYCLGKMKSLLFPFWFWNLLAYPVYFILFFWKNWKPSTMAADIIRIILTVYKVPFLGATWFLAGLFWISVLFKILYSALEKSRCRDIITVLAFLLLCLLGFYVDFPYRISRNLICGLFYMMGFYYGKSLDKLEGPVSSFLAVVCAVGFVIIAGNNSVSLGNNRYENKILFIVGACMAIYAVLYISKILSRILAGRALAWLGSRSISIVIWQFLAFRFTILLQIVVLHGNLKWLVAFPIYDAAHGWWIAYVISGLAGSVLIDYVLHHNPIAARLRLAVSRRT